MTVVDLLAPGRSAVVAIAPIAALGIVGENAELLAVAKEADSRLRSALATLEGLSIDALRGPNG